MNHATCQPYVTVGTLKVGDEHWAGWRAICRRHDWKSQLWSTRMEAIRSGAAHKRAKRTREKRR